MPCLICGSSDSRIAFDDRGFRVVECQNCKFGIVDPLPDIVTLAAMYDSQEYFATHMHYDYDTISDAEIGKQVAAAGHLHGGFLKRFLGSVSSVLEIGPGGGFSLKYFAQLGKRVKGVETSQSSAEFMRKRLGVEVDNAMLETYTDPQRYQMVMLNHVLEHFLDLRFAMSRLYDLVEPGGLLYVRVPDHDSYDRRRMEKAWPAYLPFHISYFSEKSLRLLFQQSGLEVVATHTYISENLLAGAPAGLRKLARSLVNALGLRNRFTGRTVTILGRKPQA